jgi:Tfp pilus assembly protein PilX
MGFNSEQGRMSMKHTRDERGFALIAALMANLILLAVGIVALNLSTGDIRISMRSVGDKKAVNAAEAGLHWLTVNFDAANLAAVTVTNQQVDAGGDPNTRYTIQDIDEPSTGPAQIPLPGFSIGGSQTWGQARYDATITGRNTAYNTSMEIRVGLGHGPVEMGTMSR